MPLAFSPCVLIPCYNHGTMMPRVLARLQPFGLPCIVVDDGSDSSTRQQLERLAAETANLTLIRLPQNAGKGAAVIRGLQAAAQSGFSHAVQVDADGQHAIEDIPQLLALAQAHPEALISGQPIYDDSIPRSRLYGRWITHVWVWIETLSLQLKDSMCGFRVYPVTPTLQLAQRVSLGQRMDFDTEVMVRLYWQGNTSYFVPTRVTYPPDGLSHFDAIKDNCRISLMHTRLFLGMLPRIPSLLFRRASPHWARQQEVKGLWGMRLMLLVWRLLGRKAFSLLLYPVVGVYWLTAATARRASQQWITRVREQLAARQMPIPPTLTSYRHFQRFGEAMLDKIASWRGELQFGRDVVFTAGAEETLNISDPRGKLLLVSHLGDVEACRALAQLQGGKTINALVFSENAQRFKQIMTEMAPQAGLNLMPVNDIGPDTAILLQEKLDRGEWIAIVGDRIAVNPQRGGEWRVCWSRFMGQAAPFPQGPFILAAILRCPVNLLFALRQQGKLRIYCEPFADPLLLPRADRQQALQHIIDRYAERLEHYALQSPLDWFNFFDFWRLPDPKDKE
ncbi:TPA: glycosyltransferase [Klebsiella aerogenes]|jgi:predicted LPLAT superfamily acyltransferase|uniref:glycosyltransferase family 2 protein n=1 Tax=Klebsiella aerogenes TaxID=548 RepID=UPI00063C274A|nr:glycosyltransferase family 2 protein [Klebsiella aerogenes]ATX89876.1 glycosyltransferase family 2 protein [Klebsiella aerogenes]AVE38577.1 glycosyltransferase family 2 protein [Klebsiella aerogenes]EKU0354853.1 glycosyltransferase family 2 protein [Klebsiella aerogenes]EKU6157622.1 glycosyltransferase family 2 protein [Klebsiella aerogenes]EKW1127220.1 glycosyltransferase family 2 protein [Klebsiella aerogenes]